MDGDFRSSFAFGTLLINGKVHCKLRVQATSEWVAIKPSGEMGPVSINPTRSQYIAVLKEPSSFYGISFWACRAQDDRSPHGTITRLWCKNSNVVFSDLSRLPELEILSLEGNELIYIDLTKNSKLLLVNLAKNRFGSILMPTNTQAFLNLGGQKNPNELLHIMHLEPRNQDPMAFPDDLSNF